MLSLNTGLNSIASAPATQLSTTGFDGFQSSGPDFVTVLPLPILAILALVFVSAAIAIVIELRAEKSVD